MKNRALPLVLAALLASAAHSPTVGATTMVPLSTNQLVDASDTIVQGTIQQVWTEEDSNGIVWTRTQIEVERTLKGDGDRTSWVVDQMGGSWGNHKTIVHGRARFSVGEKAVFFIEALPSGRIVLVGMGQGKFTLRQDPYSRETIVQRFNPGEAKAYDHRFLPLPAEVDRKFLIDFVDTIEHRVEQGWDGISIQIGRASCRARV